MKPKFKNIAIGTGCLLILCYAAFAVWRFANGNNDRVCKSCEIELTDSTQYKLISEKEISNLLNEHQLNPIGKTLSKIKTEDIEKLLKDNPLIKTAECYKTPSGIVHVKIHQRTPKFRIIGLESFYVDTEKKWMPASPNFSAYVPIVSGRITKSMATGEMFDFVSFLEDNPFWNAQIEQIYVRDDLKIELVPRVGDAIIILGRLENYKSKLEKLRKLYLNGFKTIGWNRYSKIDLEYEDQVICTKIGLKESPIKQATAEQKDSIIAPKI
jgi:cell division protein FtsQ